MLVKDIWPEPDTNPPGLFDKLLNAPSNKLGRDDIELYVICPDADTNPPGLDAILAKDTWLEPDTKFAGNSLITDPDTIFAGARSPNDPENNPEGLDDKLLNTPSNKVGRDEIEPYVICPDPDTNPPGAKSPNEPENNPDGLEPKPVNDTCPDPDIKVKVELPIM